MSKRNGHACRFCRINGETQCTARFVASDPQVEIHCTRPVGHDGDHVSCSRHDHRLAVWPPAAPGNEVGARIARGRFIVSGEVVTA